MKYYSSDLKLNAFKQRSQKNVVIYADFRMKAVCRKKIVALNRSIRKNLIKMKEFTRTP